MSTSGIACCHGSIRLFGQIHRTTTPGSEAIGFVLSPAARTSLTLFRGESRPTPWPSAIISGWSNLSAGRLDFTTPIGSALTATFPHAKRRANTL